MSLADLITARRDRRRELRAELTPLDQDIATDEMQALAYLEGLQRERAGAEAALAGARSMPADLRQRLAYEPDDVESPTWGTRAAKAEEHVAAIDAELARVGG